MSMSQRTRKITAVLATAVIVPAAAIGVTSATAKSSSSTGSSSSAAGHHRGGPHGPDLSKLATKLGVTQAQLKAALDAIRPTDKPKKQDRGAGLAAGIASALGVSVDKVTPILDANKPAKPATRPAPGTKPAKPDLSNLVTALSTGLSIDTATVQTALDKLQAAHEADHTARDTAMAAALAKQLNLDTATVQAALTALKPAGR